jgi:hypothetical protein
MLPYDQDPSVLEAERRAQDRAEPEHRIHVSRAVPVRTLHDVEVLNVSSHGVAIRAAAPIRVGERLRFSVNAAVPSPAPILAEVLACEPMDEGYRVRCRCLLGGFDVA